MQHTRESFIVLNTKKITVRSSDSNIDKPQCRICLNNQEQDNHLISPCGCTGSVKYIHVKCFNTWIYKKYQDPLVRQQILSTEGLKCQICHDRYMYTYRLKLKPCSCAQIRHKLCSKKFVAIATLLFVAIDLILMSVMANYAMNDQKDPQFNIRLPRFFLVYIALTFALCSALYGVYEFIKIFFVYHAFELMPHNKVSNGKKIKIVKVSSKESNNVQGVMQQSHMRMDNIIYIQNIL